MVVAGYFSFVPKIPNFLESEDGTRFARYARATGPFAESLGLDRRARLLPSRVVKARVNAQKGHRGRFAIRVTTCPRSVCKHQVYTSSHRAGSDIEGGSKANPKGRSDAARSPQTCSRSSARRLPLNAALLTKFVNNGRVGEVSFSRRSKSRGRFIGRKRRHSSFGRKLFRYIRGHRAREKGLRKRSLDYYYADTNSGYYAIVQSTLTAIREWLLLIVAFG